MAIRLTRVFCVQVITLDMDFGYNFGGVLTDFDGAMVALWASYAKPVAGEVRDMVRGLPAGPIENARDEVLSWGVSFYFRTGNQTDVVFCSQAPQR